MNSRLIRMIGIFLSTMGAAPVSASNWMIIGAEPDPAPHRSLYVMQSDDAWITRRIGTDSSKKAGAAPPSLADFMANSISSGTVLQVFEDAGGTNFIQYEVEFKCQAGLVRLARATSHDRAGKQQSGGSPEWQKVPDGWLAKAEMIACGWKNWKAAQASLPSSAAQSASGEKPKLSAPRFASLGMAYLGDYAAWTQVVDAVWAKQWPDAKQPAYVKGTPEEVAALRAKSLAVLENAKSVVSEQKKWSDIYFKLEQKAERLGGQFGLDMAGVGGLTEAEVVARWGVPSGTHQSDGVRSLAYSFQKNQYGVENVQVDIVGVGGKIGETSQSQLSTSTRQCTRTLRLMEGGAVEKAWRVFDFDIGCS